MSVTDARSEIDLQTLPVGSTTEAPLRRLVADYFESRLGTVALALLLLIIALALLAP
jgi:hypothetical protein